MTVLQTVNLSADAVKMRWKEPYVTAGINQKNIASHPKGVLAGFNVVPNAGFVVSVQIDPTLSLSVANVLETTGGYYSVTVVQPTNILIDLTAQANTTVYVVVDAQYTVGAASAAQVKVVDALTDADWVLLAKVNVPAIGPITTAHINTGYRNAVGDSESAELHNHFNLVNNPTFEATTSGWTNSGFLTLTATTYTSKAGSYSLRANLIVAGLASATTGPMPVVPGRAYRTSAWMRSTTAAVPTLSDGPVAGGNGAKLQVGFYDAAGAQIGSWADIEAAFTGAGTTWVERKSEVIAPALALTARLRIYFDNCNGTLYVDEVEFASHMHDELMKSAVFGGDVVADAWHKHTGAGLTYAGSGPFADGSTLVGPTLEDGLDQVASNLGGVSGAAKIGFAATTPKDLTVARVDLALDELDDKKAGLALANIFTKNNTITNTVVDTAALTATGNGAGAGVFATAGATLGAVGVEGTGGAGGGSGVKGQGTLAGSGVYGKGGPTLGALGVEGEGSAAGGTGVKGQGTGTGGFGVHGIGAGNGVGLRGEGAGLAAGVSGTGGASSGLGVYGTGGGPNGGGVQGVGVGNGIGVHGFGYGNQPAILGVGAGSSSGVRGQSAAIGVDGQGGGAQPGVKGTGGPTAGAVGVSGTGGSGGGVGVEGQGTLSGAGLLGVSGDVGTGNNAGVRGLGVPIASGTGGTIGVYAEGGGATLAGPAGTGLKAVGGDGNVGDTDGGVGIAATGGAGGSGGQNGGLGISATGGAGGGGNDGGAGGVFTGGSPNGGGVLATADGTGVGVAGTGGSGGGIGVTGSGVLTGTGVRGLGGATAPVSPATLENGAGVVGIGGSGGATGVYGRSGVATNIGTTSLTHKAGVVGIGAGAFGVGVIGVSAASSDLGSFGGSFHGSDGFDTHGVGGLGKGTGRGVQGNGGSATPASYATRLDGVGVYGQGGTGGGTGIVGQMGGAGLGVVSTTPRAGVVGIGAGTQTVGVMGISGSGGGSGAYGGQFIGSDSADTNGVLGFGKQAGHGGVFIGGATGNAIQVGTGHAAFTAANPVANAGFSNTLTPTNIVKAWGRYRYNLTATPVYVDGFNVVAPAVAASTFGANTAVQITFGTAMGNANYVVIFEASTPFVYVPWIVDTRTAAGFLVGVSTPVAFGSLPAPNSASGSMNNLEINFVVLGRQ